MKDKIGIYVSHKVRKLNTFPALMIDIRNAKYTKDIYDIVDTYKVIVVGDNGNYIFKVDEDDDSFVMLLRPFKVQD